MSNNIKGDMDVLRYGTSQNKNITRTIDSNEADENGVIELDSYTEIEIQNRLAVIPLSRYGSTNYLPAGVAGSFEGASTEVTARSRSLLLEDDGNMVILRPGTNGSTRGLFYTYLSNALTTTNLSSFVNTNKKYNPAYFNSQYNAILTINSDHNVVMGVCKKISDDTSHWFLSLTNNTMNDVQHTGVIIPITAFSNSVRFAMMGNTHVYVFTESVLNNRLKYFVYTIPIQDLVDQVPPVFTQVTGWTSNTFYGESYSGIDGDGIVVNNVILSADPLDKPYMLIPQNMSAAFTYAQFPDFYAAQDKATGLIRVRIIGDGYCANLQYSTRPKHSYSLTINPTTKVASLDAGNIAPLTVTLTGSGLTSQGSTYNSDPLYTLNGTRTNKVNSYYQMSNGVMFMTNSPNTSGEGNFFYRANCTTTPTSIFDSLKVRTYTTTNLVGGKIYPSFASAVGGSLVGFELLPNNTCRLMCTNDFDNFVNVTSEYIPPPTYSYKSVSLGTITGYAPSNNRNIVTNDLNHKMFISYINQSGVVSTTGGILTESRLEAPLNIDSNTNPIGTSTISVASNVLINFKNSQLAGASLASGLDTRIALYVPQQSNIPAFAIMQGITPSRQFYVKVVQVNTNVRSGNITSITYVRDVYIGENVIAGNATSGAALEAYPTVCGICIYEGTDFYCVTGTFPHSTSVVGNAYSWSFRGKILKSNSQMTHFAPLYLWYPYVSSVDLPTALPGYGFGVIDGAVDYNDGSCRLVFRSYGTTSADYDLWQDKGLPLRLITSQDVPEGYIVYFTENTPVILSGQSFMMPITNIDLRTIKANPANSTFYVYIIMSEGLAKYHISETVISESGSSGYNTFWIGTLTTNSNQIVSVNVNKRARLDIFGASLEAAGSSFPVSYGLPSQTGTINW